jgi:hypothetical protein
MPGLDLLLTNLLSPIVLAFALGAVAIDHVMTVARGPGGRKKRRIALSVGVDLEDPRNLAITRDAVSLETGLAMPAIGVAHDLYAC